MHVGGYCLRRRRGGRGAHTFGIVGPNADAFRTIAGSDRPADMAAWTISGAGIGPIERGAEYPNVIGGVTGLEASEWCTGVPILERDETTRIVLGLSDDGTQVSNMWVMSQLADGSASPATAAGIRLGSSAAELAEAYPDLALLGQRGADTWVHVVEDGPGGWIGFVVDDEAVVLIGVSDQRSVPKEWCS